MTAQKTKTESDRGMPASFDRRTGEVSGSGAGAGGTDDNDEDYDSNLHGQDKPRADPGPLAD